MNFKIFIHLLLINIITGSRSKHFLIETVTNQEEHGSDYAEDRKEEFTPTIHGNDDAEEKVEENNDSQITMEGLSNWWDNLINSNDTNINACGIGNLPTKCECDDGKSHSPQDIYKDDENNMMKVIHAFEKCKTGGSQKCECANGKKFIIPVFQDDVRKQLAALDENQAAAVEPGTDYAEEQEKEPFIPNMGMSYEQLVKWWDNMLNSNDTNINMCGKGNLPTKCDCDDGTSNSPDGIYNNDKKNMLKLVKSMADCKSGRTQKCKCANGKQVIMINLNEDDRKWLADMDETQAAVGGEEGTDYAEEPTEGVEPKQEPEKKKGSGPEVEAVPEVNYESMVKGLATMIDSDDKNMNACGKGNLPTKCVCDDGVSFEPQGIFKKYSNNWQPIMEAFALCKTGNAISCECANGGKFIMPPLNENVRKVIEAEKKARGDKGDYQLEELFKG